MKEHLRIISLLAIVYLVSSCSVNSHIMFKKEKDSSVEVITEDIPLSPKDAYLISPDDKISFSMFTEDGKTLIDITAGVSGEGQSTRLMSGGNTSYLVRDDGTVKIPVVGLVPVGGLSVFQCQEKLAAAYSKFYEAPFVQVEVVNRRVIVFPGSGGDAMVVPLENNNTTLMEVIALAGGITERGRSNVIKVMRKENDERKVYQIDLSNMDGLKYADMIVQSNDYIYIEPTKQLTREFLREVAPVVSLISSAIILFSVFSAFN